MTKNQELKMALYDFLHKKPTGDVTYNELEIMKLLWKDKEVEQIIDTRIKNAVEQKRK